MMHGYHTTTFTQDYVQNLDQSFNMSGYNIDLSPPNSSNTFIQYKQQLVQFGQYRYINTSNTNTQEKIQQEEKQIKKHQRESDSINHILNDINNEHHNIEPYKNPIKFIRSAQINNDTTDSVPTSRYNKPHNITPIPTNSKTLIQPNVFKINTANTNNTNSSDISATINHNKKSNHKRVREIDVYLDELKHKHDHSHKSMTSDPNVAYNIQITNLSKYTNENELLYEFGVYGTIYSIKVMYPLTQYQYEAISMKAYIAFIDSNAADNVIKIMQGTVIQYYYIIHIVNLIELWFVLFHSAYNLTHSYYLFIYN